MDRKELLNIIEEIIEENRERWETIQPEHAEHLLKFYLTRTGLLHEPEEGKIQFSHLSFQECLTARFIYKKIIEENLFKAPDVIKQEIMKRLNQNRWQEVILLFFSLNKEATNDILKMMENEPETQKEGEMYDSFHTLILKMLDSDEYGIKDSDIYYWVKKVIRYISMIDSEFGKYDPEKEHFRNESVYGQIESFFQSTDRKTKIESAKKILNELFDDYFEIIQKNSHDTITRNSLENILYFMVYREGFAKIFKSKVEDTLPVLLDRERFDTQFLSSFELFTFYFEEFSEPVSKIYTLDEAILCIDLLSQSVFNQFLKNNKRKYLKNRILEWEWVMENICSYSAIINIDITQNDFSVIENVKEVVFKENFAFQVDQEGNRFWRKNWIRSLWHIHAGGFERANKEIFNRYDSKQIFSFITRDDVGHIFVENVLPLMSPYNINFKFMRELTGSERKTVFIFKIVRLFSTFLVAHSDLEFCQKYRKIENPWKTYKDLKGFYDLLCNPEMLWVHLCKISTVDLDKKTFISQYKGYDNKPYSMRNMAKFVLDKGEENYPAFSSKEALDKSVELLKKASKLAEEMLKEEK